MTRRRQPSGMGVQRGEPVQREPVDLPPCRGCGAAPSLEAIGLMDGYVECLVCGIDDPCGLFGPMRPAPPTEVVDEGAGDEEVA